MKQVLWGMSGGFFLLKFGSRSFSTKEKFNLQSTPIQLLKFTADYGNQGRSWRSHELWGFESNSHSGMPGDSNMQGRSATTRLHNQFKFIFLIMLTLLLFRHIILWLFFQMQKKMQNWSNAFDQAFQMRNFEEAKNAIKRMTYYNRVIDEVVKKLW